MSHPRSGLAEAQESCVLGPHVAESLLTRRCGAPRGQKGAEASQYEDGGPGINTEASQSRSIPSDARNSHPVPSARVPSPPGAPVPEEQVVGVVQRRSLGAPSARTNRASQRPGKHGIFLNGQTEGPRLPEP
jgi:hypothetical protein